ncbi:Uncharacterised protein [Mycobacteroides abscessus subsp. abscessus]|nr:Uncharacterised protein [Mycobacteroides abscessus subsp. abscessus]
MELDVLPVGEVGGAAGELVGDVGDRAQLLGREPAAVDAHAEHEVLVLELVRLEGGGPPAVDARLALGVETPPAEAAVEVIGVDRREAGLRVDLFDPCTDVEAVVLGFEHLVAVERFAAVDLPLPVGLLRSRRGPVCAACGALLHVCGHCHLPMLVRLLGQPRYTPTGLLNKLGSHKLVIVRHMTLCDAA